MKITCDRDDLTKALARARSISSAKSPMPILSTALLRPVGKRLQVCATDIEVAYKTTVPANITGAEVMVCVNAGDLAERVKAMPTGDVILDATTERVVVTSKGSKRRFERAAIDGAEFPLMPPQTNGDSLTMPAAALLTMLQATAFAIDTDPNKVSGSLLLRWNNEKVWCGAADGRRVSHEERALVSNSSGRTLLPLRAVTELRKLLDVEGDVVVTATEGNTFFDFGEFDFSTKRPIGEFPSYEDWPVHRLPDATKIHVQSVIEAVAAVSLAAGRGDTSQNLHLQFSASELHIYAESADKGKASDVVAIERSGADFDRMISGEFLRDALNASASEFAALSIDIANEYAPFHVEPWEPQTGRKHYGIVAPARK